MIVSSPREALWRRLNAQLAVPWSDDFQAIGLVVDDCLCAVTGYNSFIYDTVQMHTAVFDSTKPTRQYIRAIFEYAFVECEVQWALATVKATNAKAIEQNERLGFKRLLELPKAAKDHSVFLYGMRKDDCKWLGELNG